MLIFECPAASRTSASVLPQASAWLKNVCRPWWTVNSLVRSVPKHLQAVLNRRRIMWRLSSLPSVCWLSEQTNLSSGMAPCLSRSSFQASISSSLPRSHQSGTRRGLFPLGDLHTWPERAGGESPHLINLSAMAWFAFCIACHHKPFVQDHLGNFPTACSVQRLLSMAFLQIAETPA